MPAQVPSDMSARRAEELSALAEQLSTAFARRMDGKSSEVLIEKVEADGTGEGYTPEYVHVSARNLQPSAQGCIVPLRLTFVDSPTLEGHLLADGRTDVSQNTAS